MTSWVVACALGGACLVLLTAWWCERRARRRLEARLDEREDAVVRALRDTTTTLHVATEAIKESTKTLRG